MEHTLVLDKKDFSKFIEQLKSFGTVYAPVSVSEQSYAYKPITHSDDIALQALRTILPPKKFLYPQEEPLLSFNQTGFKQELPKVDPFVIFGVHPCDLSGMIIMDKIFMSEPGDVNYIERRKQIMVVGLSCLPDKHCFCESMGTDSVESGYDVFLTDVGDAYFLQVATARGAGVLQNAPFLRKTTEPDKQAFKDFWNNRKELFTNRFNTTNLPALLDLEWENPVWEELGNRCLSCGNCTFVCPTCYCFDLVDIAQLNGEGQRVRQWDSCQFTGFAKVAGNYNFRPGPIDRLKFWYRHKLHGFEDAYQLPTCVGCGRCTVSCPADIDDIVGTVVRLENGREKHDGKEENK